MFEVIWSVSLTSIAAACACHAARRELGVRTLITLTAVLGAIAAGAVLLSFSAGAALHHALPVAALLPLCVLISETDRRSHIIPDSLVVAIAMLALASPFRDTAGLQTFGALFLGALFFLVRTSFALAGRDDALGLGDVKLAAAMGAFLGPYYGLIGVAISGAATIAVMAAGMRGATIAAGAPFGVGLSAALLVLAALRFLGLP